MIPKKNKENKTVGPPKKICKKRQQILNPLLPFVEYDAVLYKSNIFKSSIQKVSIEILVCGSLELHGVNLSELRGWTVLETNCLLKWIVKHHARWKGTKELQASCDSSKSYKTKHSNTERADYCPRLCNLICAGLAGWLRWLWEDLLLCVGIQQALLAIPPATWDQLAKPRNSVVDTTQRLGTRKKHRKET